MTRPDSILAAALALPNEERAKITLRLVDSFDEPVEDGVEEAWEGEIAARVEALRSGQAKVIPFERAMAAAHERIRARRG